jgi:hypothetical protein
MAGEDSKFIAKIIPPRYANFFQDNEDCSFLVIKLLDEMGSKKAGRAQAERSSFRLRNL